MKSLIILQGLITDELSYLIKVAIEDTLDEFLDSQTEKEVHLFE